LILIYFILFFLPRIPLFSLFLTFFTNEFGTNDWKSYHQPIIRQWAVLTGDVYSYNNSSNSNHGNHLHSTKPEVKISKTKKTNHNSALSLSFGQLPPLPPPRRGRLRYPREDAIPNLEISDQKVGHRGNFWSSGNPYDDCITKGKGDNYGHAHTFYGLLSTFWKMVEGEGEGEGGGEVGRWRWEGGESRTGGI